MLTTSVAAGALALIGIFVILVGASRAFAAYVRAVDYRNKTEGERLDLAALAIAESIRTLSQTFATGMSDAPKARLAEQDAKIDGLRAAYLDFLDKQERLAARINGAKGGRPRGGGGGRVEEQEHVSDDDDDAPPRDGQGVLPMPDPVASVRGPVGPVFAPLPPFRLR